MNSTIASRANLDGGLSREERRKTIEKHPFLPVLSELRSVPRRSAAVELPTAKLPVPPSNGLLNNPRRWGCLVAREETRELPRRRRFYRKAGMSAADVSSGVGALSTNSPRCRSSSAILLFYRRRRDKSNSRDDDGDDADLLVLRKTRCSQREAFPRVRKSRAEEPRDVRNRPSPRSSVPRKYLGIQI